MKLCELESVQLTALLIELDRILDDRERVISLAACQGVVPYPEFMTMNNARCVTVLLAARRDPEPQENRS